VSDKRKARVGKPKRIKTGEIITPGTRRRGRRKMAQSAVLEAHQAIPSSHAVEASRDVFATISELADQHGNLIKQFWEAFEERATDPFLAESREQDGLALTLEGFLGNYPDKFYLNFSQREPAINTSIDQIKVHFSSALERIVHHNPHVFQSLQEIHEETGWSLFDTLKALFVKYINNKNAYPY
jgi:hypothetical protein